jgi:phage-related baseplate assembly protein
MALFSLDDLTEPASRDEVQAAMYRIYATLGVSTTSWAAGAIVRTVSVAVSAILSSFSVLQAEIAASGFMELAEDDWLTLCARYVYGVERIDATFATGKITLTNGGGGVFTLDPDDLIVSSPSTGKSYRNTAAISLGAGVTLTDVPIQAVEAGNTSTAGPDTITVLTTFLIQVTCTNPAAVVGSDAESDAALRARCREKLGSLSPMGPWDAYAYAARISERAPGENIGITRTRVLKDGYGHVTLIVADPDGVVAPSDVDIINENIQREATPLAVSSSTESAVPVPFTVSYEAWVYNTSGNNDDQIRDLIRLRVANFFAAQPIGGNLLTPTPPGFIFQDAIRAAVAAALQPQIFHVLVSSPASDTTLATTEVGVLVAFGTEVIHQVPVPEGASL